MKNYFILFLIALLCSTPVAAQPGNDIDSLLSLITRSNGIDKYDPLIRLTRTLASTDYEKAIPYVKEAYDIANEFSDSLKIVEAGRITGQLLNGLDRYNEAKPFLERTFHIAERNNFRTEYKKIISNLADVYTFQAQYDKALSLQFKVLALREADRDTIDVGYTYNNIGLVYYRLKSFKEAITYYKKALNIQLANKEAFEVEKVFMNIGHCYNNLKQFDQAKNYFNDALKHCKENCNQFAVLEASLGLGIAYFELGQIDKSFSSISKSHVLAQELKKTRYVGETLLYLAKIDISNENFVPAQTKLHQIESLAIKEDLNALLLNVYETLSFLNKKTKDFEQSLEYLEKYNQLKNLVYHDELSVNLAEVKSDYEQRENIATINANLIKIEEQRNMNLALLVIAVLSALLIIVLYRSNLIFKRMNRLLTEAKNLIYEQNKSLEIRNKELDRHVEKKTEELTHVNLSLKKMNDELAIFIHKVAEDISAPLASLKGLCQVASIDIHDSTVRNYIHRFSSISENLNFKLNRLLAINRINHSEIRSNSIEVKSLVDEIISNYWKRGLPTSIILRKKILTNCVIKSDHELLITILENVIDNAIKFCMRSDSPAKEHIIELMVVPDQNKRICFRLSFNGKVEEDYYNSDQADFISFEAPFHVIDGNNNFSQDLFLIKTAAKKMGGNVNVKMTPEGLNEISFFVNNNN